MVKNEKYSRDEDHDDVGSSNELSDILDGNLSEDPNRDPDSSGDEDESSRYQPRAGVTVPRAPRVRQKAIVNMHAGPQRKEHKNSRRAEARERVGAAHDVDTCASKLPKINAPEARREEDDDREPFSSQTSKSVKVTYGSKGSAKSSQGEKHSHAFPIDGRGLRLT